MKTRRGRGIVRRGDVAAVIELARRWREGWRAGDADALADLYAARPVLLAQGRPAVRGKAAIRSLYRATLSELRIRSRGVLREIQVAGDWGYFWSTYTLSAVPKAGGDPIHASGKSVFIVRRQRDGIWKIARLIDNSDQ